MGGLNLVAVERKSLGTSQVQDKICQIILEKSVPACDPFVSFVIFHLDCE